ncbi:MAG: endonuclease/exonuclease/phosphatase family protein [Acidobacteria bacterium]|nr:endonuclease/exonuclease/phosphatase family protein [Acidobacteriota bacterium]
MRLLLLALFALPLAAADLRVMTFNVRYPNPRDGEDIWEKRRDFFVETVRRHKPDLMGTQELFYTQAEYIVEKMPELAWFGLSRRGNKEDEHMGVFYRKDRLKVMESGNFWLSETPEVAGSSSWNMSLPRMVTWAVFEDLKTKRRFTYYNTHFAHRGQVDDEARRQGAMLIAKRMPKEGAFLLTGDFNAAAGQSPSYSVLVPALKDAYLTAAKKSGPEGTFHGFKGTPGKARIDWILYRAPWKVKSAATLTDSKDGRYPSDHFPVLAVFRL